MVRVSPRTGRNEQQNFCSGYSEPTGDLFERVRAPLGLGGELVDDRLQLGVHLGRFAVELLLGGEQRLQVRHQEQYSRVVQGRQLVVQFRVQHLVRPLCLLQRFASLCDLQL